MSSQSIAAFAAHRAAQGRPVAQPIDVTGRATMVAATKARRAGFTTKGIRWSHEPSKAAPSGAGSK